MAKTLYMMRHGETLFNRLKKIQGACDSPLTPKGIADAQRVGAYFQAQGITFDHAYSSTQERASDTLELVTKQPYERLKGIKEWNFGVFEGESEVLNPKPDPVRRSHGDFFCQHGGASFMFLRQWLSMDEIERQGIVLHNCAVIKYQYDAGRFTFEKIINLAATDKN
ncbi:phosphoglycerate mutase [Lactiplantibacillus plantarum]|nr:phosphoglycerate mutase [Lactiplantibacillus plantarum]